MGATKSKSNLKEKVHIHYDRDSYSHRRRRQYHDYGHRGECCHRYGYRPSYGYGRRCEQISISVYPHSESYNEPLRRYSSYDYLPSIEYSDYRVRSPQKARKVCYYEYY